MFQFQARRKRGFTRSFNDFFSSFPGQSAARVCFVGAPLRWGISTDAPHAFQRKPDTFNCLVEPRARLIDQTVTQNHKSLLVKHCFISQFGLAEKTSLCLTKRVTEKPLDKVNVMRSVVQTRMKSSLLSLTSFDVILPARCDGLVLFKRFSADCGDTACERVQYCGAMIFDLLTFLLV